MNPRRLLLVVLLLAVLALGVHLLSHSGKHGEVVMPTPAARPLLPGDPQHLRALSMFHQPVGRFVKLERVSPGEWRLTEPIEDQAEPAVVANSLAALFSDDWQPAPADWQGRSDADLGLDPPQLTVEARFDDGSMEEIRIGATDATGDAYAALRRGERLRIGQRSYRLLSRPVDEWRDKRVVSMPSTLQRIEWQPPAGQGEGFVLQRLENKWYLYQPFSAPLSPLARDGVARLLGARGDELADETIGSAEQERLRTGGTLRLHGSTGVQVVHLLQGAAWNESRPYLIPVHPQDFDVLRSSPEELRSPLLLDVERNEIVSLRLRRAGEEMVFHREGDGWAGPNAIYVGEADLRRGIAEDPMHAALDDLLERACAVEQGVREPRPEPRPAGELLLSRSFPPVERGGQKIEWWPGPDGRSRVAVPEARECVPLEGTDLDTLWDQLHRRFYPE